MPEDVWNLVLLWHVTCLDPPSSCQRSEPSLERDFGTADPIRDMLPHHIGWPGLIVRPQARHSCQPSGPSVRWTASRSTPLRTTKATWGQWKWIDGTFPTGAHPKIRWHLHHFEDRWHVEASESWAISKEAALLQLCDGRNKWSQQTVGKQEEVSLGPWRSSTGSELGCKATKDCRRGRPLLPGSKFESRANMHKYVVWLIMIGFFQVWGLSSNTSARKEVTQ